MEAINHGNAHHAFSTLSCPKETKDMIRWENSILPQIEQRSGTKMKALFARMSELVTLSMFLIWFPLPNNRLIWSLCMASFSCGGKLLISSHPPKWHCLMFSWRRKIVNFVTFFSKNFKLHEFHLTQEKNQKNCQMRKLHFNLVEKCLCCEAKVVEYVANNNLLLLCLARTLKMLIRIFSLP